MAVTARISTDTTPVEILTALYAPNSVPVSVRQLGFSARLQMVSSSGRIWWTETEQAIADPATLRGGPAHYLDPGDTAHVPHTLYVYVWSSASERLAVTIRP